MLISKVFKEYQLPLVLKFYQLSTVHKEEIKF
jgi:hypothetical protein